jgi:hypothetical protein
MNVQTPPWIEKRLARYGLNHFGGALFRIIWSDSHIAWSFAKQMMAPRYPELHCWVLERWCAPAQYGSPVSWELVKDWEPGSPNFGQSVLGPYPARGAYEPVYKAVELETTSAIPRVAVELMCRLIDAGKGHTRSERWAAIKDREEKSKRDWDKFFDDYCAEKMGSISCRSGLRFGPWKHRGQQRGPDNVKFEKTTRDLPIYTRQTGFVQAPPAIAERLRKKRPGTMVQ